MLKKSTGYYDKNDKLIYDGDKLFDNGITYTVTWSDYRHDWIGFCLNEIYVASSDFNQYEVNKIIV